MKFKALMLIGLVMICVSFVAPVRAELKTFGPFTLDVPDKWVTQYFTESGSATLILLNPQENAMVEFMLTRLETETFEDFMNFLAQEPGEGCGLPEKVSDNTWTISQENQEYGLSGSETIIRLNQEELLSQRVLGQDSALGDMLKSFKFDPNAKF